ncbi:partial Starvation-sensing protein RspB [Anaerolineales bacterium]|nr:partial Starvation-sensing protein RspB [Anaerolineales bacterium]
MSKAKTLFFTAPRKVEVREAPLPSLKDDEVLVETICSAISAGTEMLVYRGEFPQLTDVYDELSSELKYPLAYGYACVGRVMEAGRMVNREWLNKLVFGFHSHSSHFVSETDNLFLIPSSLSPESACFLPNMETAVNLVQDGAPILGERVLVLGQGVVGLLTASLLSEFPLERLVTVDQFDLRRKALQTEGQRSKVKSLAPTDLQPFDATQGKPSAFDPFDLTFELSGAPSALNDAIELTSFSGRIVIGSWYGQKRAEINFGGDFHRSRIKLVSSQVSTISPELSGRWDKARRFDVAWKALERIKPEKWITHRFPIEEADGAYQLLDKSPQEAIQVIFDFGTQKSHDF